jgi:hypothetical protein
VTLQRDWRLRKIFGFKGEEVTGDLRKLQVEELHNFAVHKI